MSNTMRVLAIVILVVSGWAFGQQAEKKTDQTKKKEQPSLVELARKGRAARESAKSAKVITNEDLAKMTGSKVGVSSTGAAPIEEKAAKQDKESDQKSSAEKEEEKDQQKDLSFWENAFSEARLNLKNAVNRGMVLQLRMNNLRNAYFSEDDGSTQARLQKELSDNMSNIEKNKLEVQKAKEALEKLQKEARDAGLSPQEIRKLTGDVPTVESITSLNPSPQG